MSKRLHALALLGSILLSSACSSDPTPARVDSGTADTGSSETSAGDYPAAPYGTDVGTVIENHTFPYSRPAGLSSASGPVSLKDYYAMRTSGKRFLVLNVAAFWCSPCKEEAKSLQIDVVPKYKPKGVEFLSVVLQTGDRSPTGPMDIDTWITTFGIDQFAVADDPDGFVTKFFDPNLMPLNMIIDLSTMKIVNKTIGANLTEVQSQLDKLLGGV